MHEYAHEWTYYKENYNGKVWYIYFNGFFRKDPIIYNLNPCSSIKVKKNRINRFKILSNTYLKQRVFDAKDSKRKEK